MKAQIDNIKAIDRMLTFDNQFYIITVVGGDDNSVEYCSFFPSSLIELHRYIPEIKNTCKRGNCTAYISVNPLNFYDGYNAVLKADNFQEYDTLKNAYASIEPRNNIVFDLPCRSTETYKQIISIIKKYTDEYFRLDNFDGQSIVVKNPTNIKQLLTEISSVDNCTISYKVVLFGKHKN